METDNINFSPSGDNPQNKKNSAKNSKGLQFIQKYSVTLSNIMVIIIIILWAVLKLNSMEKRAVLEKEQLAELYETKLDSLNIASMEITGKVFSWAVRSEMTRENMEQVDQYFNNFIKLPNIKKVQLIDPETSQIILSTDKKDEGSVIENTLILQAERTYHLVTEEGIKIISPVMGVSSKIGVIVIEI